MRLLRPIKFVALSSSYIAMIPLIANLSLGQAFALGPATAGKSAPTAKECPEGQEWRVQKTWGCHPRLKPELDPACGLDFISNLQDKEECLFSNDMTACLSLSLTPAGIVGSGAAVGGAVGALAGRLQKAIFKEVPEGYRQKYQDVLESVVRERKLAVSAWEMVRSARDAATNELLSNAIEKSPSPAAHAAATKAKIESFLNSSITFSPADKLRIVPYVESALKGSNLLSSNIAKIVQTKFPQEFSKLKPHLDSLAKNLLTWTTLTSSELKGSLNTDATSGVKKSKVEIQREILGNIKAINELSIGSFDLNFVKSLLLDHLGSKTLGTEKRLIGRLKGKGELAQQEARKSKTRGGTGSTLSAAGAIFGGLAASNLGKADIDACSAKLGLSEPEINYLTNGRIVAPTRAARDGLNGCDGFVLHNPTQTLYDMILEFGGVPQGMCKIARGMNDRLDSLVNQPPNDFNLTCEAYQDKSTEFVTDPSSGKTKLGKFKLSSNHIFEVPYMTLVDGTTESEAIEYPDFRYITAYHIKEDGKKGARDDLKTNSQRQLNYFMHPPGQTELRPDLRNYSLDCSKAELQSDRGHLCEINRAVLRAQIAKTLKTPHCETPLDSPSSATSSPSPASTAR